MTRQVDIAGGGIAGLALGLALRQAGVPVCIHEAATYPRHRLCGEFLSGVGERELTALRLEHLLTETLVLREAAWFSAGRLIHRSTLPEPAYGISRWRLDAAMAETFSRGGGRLHCEDRVPVRPADISEGWVFATGRPPVKDGPWYAEKQHYENLETLTDLEMHLGSGGYAGIARIGGGVANVCALLPASAGALPRATLPDRLRWCGLGALAGRLERAQVIPGSHCGTARFQTGWQSPPVSAESVLRIGDYSAVVAPFSGHGMGMAILAALEAVPALTAWSAGRSSWRETVLTVTTALRRKFQKRLLWSAWLHPLLLRPAGQFFIRSVLRTGLNPARWLYHKMR